jgi:penicillin-binding protein-related factor A (putative recombinase)
MATPLWKQAEKDFEAFFSDKGKGAAVFRLTDTAAAKATGGKSAFVAAQPADYICTVEGQMFFAEVKSTQDANVFKFGNIQKGQIAASRRQIAAGGHYFFFVKAEQYDQWYCIPAVIVHTTLRQKKSMTWSELEAYKYAVS